MAIKTICVGCQDGEHSRHQRIVQAPPEGGVGGAICDCEGECRENEQQCPTWLAHVLDLAAGGGVMGRRREHRSK
jgi:hypothetical protein